MPLDLRGDIAAGEIGLWGPIAIITGVLTVRYGFEKDAGWFFLCLFALTRMAAGALVIASEMIATPMPDLLIAAHALFSAGLALLFLSAIGFLGLAGQHQYSEFYRMTLYFRAVAAFSVIAMGLSIAGELLGTHINPDVRTGTIIRRVASGMYGYTFLVLFALTIYIWIKHRYYMKHHRRNLLAGVTFGLLALGVRVAYGILDSWSSSDPFGAQLSSNPTLAQSNSTSGNWVLYLVMGLVMEWLAGAIFLFSSTILMRRRRRRY